MKFLLDANLPAQLAREFIAEGHECVHIEMLVPRYTPDIDIAQIANVSGAIVVTRDADFAQFSRDGVLKVPLVWLRFKNLRRAALAATLRQRLPVIAAAIADGQKIVILR